MKIGIVSSDSVKDYDSIKQVLDKIIFTKDTIILSKPDCLAKQYADNTGIKSHVYKSNLVNESDYLVAFWNGVCEEITSLIKEAEKKNKNIIKIILLT